MTSRSQMVGPWRVQARRQVYSNPWIDVVHHDVTTPAGTPGIYGTVHFKNRAIAVLPLTEDGDTWLVGQHRFPLDAYSWEVPEGGAAAGEDPLAAAARELKEETGLVAERWERLFELHLSNSVTDEHALAYLARDLREGAAEPEATEALALRKLPFAEAYAMVLGGQITDALSVATILRVHLRLFA